MQNYGRLARLDSWLRAHPLAADSIYAALLGPLFLAASLATIYEDGSGGAWAGVIAVSVLVLHVAIAFRRRFPEGSFATVSGALGLQAVAPFSAVPRESVFLACAAIFPVALYSYCLYGRRPRLGLAVGLVGTVMLTVRAIVSQPIRTTVDAIGDATFLGLLLACVAAAWSLARYRQMRLAYVVALEERAHLADAERVERERRAVLDERARIAREMHDVVAHSLSVIVSQAQGGRYAARTQPERATDVLATIAETGRQALTDMRGLLGVLRADTPLADGSAERGPQPTLAELPDLLDRVRATGLTVTHVEEGVPRPLGAAAELAVFRLVQESLTNTMKHAGPDATAAVELVWAGDALTVTVSDTGRRAGGGPRPPSGGQGLIGMRERLSVVGGTVSAGPRLGGGFGVSARLPYRARMLVPEKSRP